MKKYLLLFLLLSFFVTPVFSLRFIDFWTGGATLLLAPERPDPFEGFEGEEEPSPAAKTLMVKAEPQFWEPGYLQPKPEPTADEIRETRMFYVMGGTLGTQLRYPSVPFSQIGAGNIGATGTGSNGVLLYGGEFGFHASGDLMFNAAFYTGNGNDGSNVDSSSQGKGGAKRFHSISQYQAGITYVLGRYFYVSAYAGIRETKLVTSLTYQNGIFVTVRDIDNTNYTKFTYGFGLGFNFEIGDHLLFRAGGIFSPSLWEGGNIKDSMEYPIQLTAGLGVVF